MSWLTDERISALCATLSGESPNPAINALVSGEKLDKGSPPVSRFTLEWPRILRWTFQRDIIKLEWSSSFTCYRQEAPCFRSGVAGCGCPANSLDPATKLSQDMPGSIGQRAKIPDENWTTIRAEVYAGEIKTKIPTGTDIMILYPGRSLTSCSKLTKPTTMFAPCTCKVGASGGTWWCRWGRWCRCHGVGSTCPEKVYPEEKKSYVFLRVLTWIFGFLTQIFGFLTHSYAMIFFIFKHFEKVRWCCETIEQEQWMDCKKELQAVGQKAVQTILFLSAVRTTCPTNFSGQNHLSH